MRKTFKTLGVIISIILIITVTGCNDSKNEVGETNSLVKIPEVVSDDKPIIDKIPNDPTDSNEEVSAEMELFLKILTPDATTADFKSYIEEKIQYVSQREAEKMLEYLLIYQTETIENFPIIVEFFD